jgi:NarL family two-component system sensor histidine kinase YdfH
VIFLWELLVSFGVVMDLVVAQQCVQGNLLAEQAKKMGPLLQGNCTNALEKVGVNIPLMALFTGLMILHGYLHWLALSNRFPRRLIWVYIFLQIGLIVLLGIIAQQALDSTTLVFSLVLVLLLEIIGLLQYTQTTLVIIGSFVLLLLLASVWQIWTGGATDPLSFIGNWQTSTIPLFLPFVTGFLILYLAQFQARRRAEQTHQELAVAHQQLQQATTRIEDLTLLTERQRLARELHDTLAQSLAGLIRQLDVVDLHLTREQLEPARVLVQESSATARGALTAARSAIDNLRLRGGMAEDLLSEVAAEAEHFRMTTGLPCATQVNALVSISPALAEPITRIVGEGLVNIARHAQARRAWITTSLDDGEILIEIGDDGIGFEFPTSAYLPGHYGLVGLSERARLLGGDMEVISSRGQGSVLRFHIPLERSKVHA